MTKLGFTYWADAKHWVGYLDEFPDYWMQGESLEELRENLGDLYRDLTSGQIPFVRSTPNWNSREAARPGSAALF